MRCKWKKIKIANIVKTNALSLKNDNCFEYVNYLDTGNITNNKIGTIQKINLSEEKLPCRAKRRVKHNSILYSTVRPNQKHYGILKDIPDNFIVSTGFIVIDADIKEINPDFLFYLITQQFVTDKLQVIAEQSVSTYPSIKPSDIEELEFYIPEKIEDQIKIASILNAITNKIELNTSLNHHLEQMAQAIFKNWFVENKTSQVQQFTDLFTFVKGKKPNVTSNMPINGFLPYLTIDAMMSNAITFADPSNMAIAQQEDILMVMDGASSGTVYFGKNGIIGSTFALIKVKDVAMREIVFQALKFYEDEIKQHNTGSAIPHTDKNFVLHLELPILKNITEITKILIILRQKIINNMDEFVRLAALRDTLLPRLMSGELSVADVEIGDAK